MWDYIYTISNNFDEVMLFLFESLLGNLLILSLIFVIPLTGEYLTDENFSSPHMKLISFSREGTVSPSSGT